VKLKLAMVLACALNIAGILLLGDRVAETLGKGIILKPLAMMEILPIVFAVGAWLTIASYFKSPISTTQAMIGAIVGLGTIIGFSYVNWSAIALVFIGLAISPILGFVLAYLTYTALQRAVLSKIKGLSDVEKREKLFAQMLLVAVMITQFSRGANDIANAIAPLIHVVELTTLLIIGGIGATVGLLILGRRVLLELGTSVVKLTPSSAFAAQIATAVVMFCGTWFGLPLSGTAVLVAALIGVGYAKKIKVNTRTVKGIAFAWGVTFPASAFFSIAIYLGLQFF
jgi:PiT family inorganic phosphate transporter